MITFPFGFLGGSAVTPEVADLLLNNIPYSSGAFALRKLDKNYTGSCIKVRESSGNTLADIGFDANGDLDTTALLAHTGANSGYVHTWYDQSGLGYNATQTTNGSQPRIVNSGTVDTKNSEPAILLDGTGFFDIAIPNTTNFIGLMVASTDQSGSYFGPSLSGPGTSRSYIMMHITDDRYYTKNSAGAYAYSDSTYTDSDQHLLTAYGLQTPTIHQYRDGDVIASTNTSGGGTASFGYIGKDNATPQRGYLQEIVYYDEDRYPELTRLMSDVGAKYRGWSDYSLFSTEFDGVNDIVQCGLTPSFEKTDSFSASAWVKLDTLGTQRGIVGKYNSANLGWHIRTLTTNKLRFSFATNGANWFAADSTTTLATDTWYHVVVTYDGSQANTGMKIYINGSLETMTTTGGGTVTTIVNTIPNHIGVYAGSTAIGFWDGNIDEVAVFSSELSASNVTTIYNGGVPADLTSLSPTTWYRMGDESGAPYLTNKMAYSKYSMNFDGVDDYVDTGMTIEDMLGSASNNEFTISFWVKNTPNSTYNGMIGATTNTGWTDGIGIYTYMGGVMRLFVNNYNGGAIGAKVDTSALTAGQWYHILMCYDADLGSDPATKNLIVYVDGVEAGDAPRGTATGAIAGRSNVLELGRFLNNHYNMLGNLDEVAFWNTDKRADVATIYNSGVPNDISGLNPVAYYKMGEGAIFPQIPNEMAYSKQSMNFDGVDDYVEAAIDGTATGAFGSGAAKEFTISFWLKNDSGVTAPVAFNWGDTIASLSPYILIWPQSGVIRYLMWTGAGAATFKIGTEAFPAGVWGHIALSRTASDNTWRLYVNGVADTTEDDTGTTDSKEANAQKVWLGEGIYNPTLGNIDDFALFTTALSQSDITSIYNNGVPNDISSLSPYTYWKMGDGDYFPTLTDSGSGSNGGTATNMSGADIEFETPNGWGTSTNMLAADIEGVTANGNGGTMTNMTQADIVQDAPKYSRLSVDFDGVNDYVDVSGVASSLQSDNTFTISLWAKGDYENLNPAFSLSTGSDASKTIVIYPYDTNVATDDCRIWYNGTNIIQTGNTSLTGWNHFCFVSNGATSHTVYINGVSAGTSSTSKTLDSALDTCEIGGASNFSQYFEGNIDEVSIFDSALTSANVATIYNNGRPTDISSLSPVGWWRMGEGDTYPMLNNEQAYSHRSVYLDGVTAVVTLPTFATILGTTNVFSVSLWVNPAAFANYDGLIGSSTNQFWGDGFGIGYNSGSTNMSFWINGYGNKASGAYAITSNYGKWVHVVGVYDGTLGSANTKIYINGVVGTTTDDFTANVSATGNNIVIGRVNNQAIHAIEANFDDVAIFSTALSQSDVTSIYNNGTPNDISTLSPVGYWKMGDGDTYPTLTDNAGSNDGTMTNMTADDITGAQTTGIMTNMTSADIENDTPE